MKTHTCVMLTGAFHAYWKDNRVVHHTEEIFTLPELGRVVSESPHAERLGSPKGAPAAIPHDETSRLPKLKLDDRNLNPKM
eukprot:8772159-Pyramimonas_sp.AAC.1